MEDRTGEGNLRGREEGNYFVRFVAVKSRSLIIRNSCRAKQSHGFRSDFRAKAP